MNFVEKTSIPCMIVLRKDKFSKVCKLAQVDLCNESDLGKDMILALLEESLDQFRQGRNGDRNFIRGFEEKMNRRRQIATDRINHGLLPA